MIHAALFDFDLTLADSRRGVADCVEYGLRRMGIPCPDQAAISKTIGLSLARTFESLTGIADADRAEEFSTLFVERANEVMASLTTVYASVPPAIEKLRAEGIKTAIVSTKFRYRIEAILARDGLSSLFDLIVGGEDVDRHKPHPDGLLRALSALGLAPGDVVYVGDHPVDAQAAQHAGIRFYAVPTGASASDEFTGYPATFLASLDHLHGEITTRRVP